MSTTELSALKRRRGAIKGSITRLTTKVAALETKGPDPSVATHAQQLAKRLETLDSDYKARHFAILDVTESEEQLATEQEALDAHDDEVLDLNLRLQALMTPTIPTSVGELTPNRGILERRQAQIQARLMSMHDKLSHLKDDGSDIHLVYLYQEHLADLKRKLSELRNKILVITADVSDPLMSDTQKQEDSIFDMSVRVKKLLFLTLTSTSSDSTPSTASATETRGVKLPKIDVPTFDGELLHWQTFWEQFSISVDSRSDISNTKKLVYLRHSLKDRSAKNVIEGLSHSGDQYGEAIDSLKARYDRPRIIHQAHVRKIYEVPNLKDGSGRELRRFHDTIQQHLRALKAMKEEPTGSFITALMELKLDKDTMFEWQKASQEAEGIPHYEDLLKFINLRAQAAETCSSEVKKQHVSKKVFPRSATAFAATTSDSSSNCSLCKTQKHPLYACPQFKQLPHEKMLSTARSCNVCLNCLKPGHFAKSCGSNNKCKKCQKSHHTLLHIDARSPSDNKQSSSNVESVETSSLAVTPMIPSYAQSTSGSTLLMTCQMLVHAPDGTSIRARGLLDSGSSASFISERLAQSLRLPLSTRIVRISGITGACHGSPLQSVTTFTISPLLLPAETLQLSAVVVPKVTCDLHTQPIHFNAKWSHLNGLHLADPDFGRPKRIDILHGIDIYADVLLHGRQNGPPGTPVAFEIKFGWVLSGKADKLTVPSIAASHHVATLCGDDLLRKFWEIEECPRDISNHSPEERTVVQHFAKNHNRNKDGRFVVPLPKNPAPCYPTWKTLSLI